MAEIITDKLQRYTYSFDKNTGELEYPSVFLVNKRFNILGQLYPVSGLEIIVNENSANEINFTHYKPENDYGLAVSTSNMIKGTVSQETLKVDVTDLTSYGYDETEELLTLGFGNVDLYNKLKTDCIIKVTGFGYFSVKVNEEDNSTGVYKQVSGNTLANFELSNLLATLEINSEDDIARDDYYVSLPTIFYRDSSRYNEYDWTDSDFSGFDDSDKITTLEDSSLLHRILTYAPHYSIGHVDDTLKYVQKTFSWDKSTIEEIFNEIAEEVGCIFTFDTYLDDDGTPMRVVNAYDITYCKQCYENGGMSLVYKTYTTSTYRNIVNGVCQNCGSADYVYDYGNDTDIFITTENLSDDIVVEPENEVKNVFVVEGGDDVIDSAVQALSMTSNNKIMMFSNEQKADMSDELREKLTAYEDEYEEQQESYSEIIETEYNILDLILYLESGKMPQLETDVKTLDEEVEYLLTSITDAWNNSFYISTFSNVEGGYLSGRYTVSSSAIKNLFTLYLDEGYSISITNGDLPNEESNGTVQWNGVIKIYETSDRDNYAEIHCFDDSTSTYVSYSEITDTDGSERIDYYSDFQVILTFGDENTTAYMEYIEQYCELTLADYKETEYKNEEVKDWTEYCYNRLESFADGYVACIEVLDEMTAQSTVFADVATSIRANYSAILSDIYDQMDVLIEQINALYECYGVYTYTEDDYGNITYDPEYVDEDFEYSNSQTYLSVLKAMANSNSAKFIGTSPISCSVCNSTNVGIATSGNSTYNYCKNCGATGSDITNYSDLATQVYTYCNTHDFDTLSSEAESIRSYFNIKNYLGDDALYNEFYSFVKEDTYSNSNYTSDGCNTNEQILAKANELLAKAKLELSQACEQQYTVSAPVSALLAEKWKNWDVNTKYYDSYESFMLGNWMRVRLDTSIYKLRLMSINFSFDTIDNISVTFSDVTKNRYGVLSDVTSILSQASSISSSYDYYATQAEQGSTAQQQINLILEKGLDSALASVLAGNNQEITIDRHGIMLKKYLEEYDNYSPYQMKLINRNLVMTTDNWNTASIAIGYGMLPDGTMGYGIWANNIIGGQITCTDNLTIVGGNGSVVINGDGITLSKNSISTSAIDGLDDALSDASTELTTFQKTVSSVLLGDDETIISSDSIISPKIGGGYLYIANTNSSNNKYSVEINPCGTSFTGHNEDYIFNIAKNSSIIMGIDTSGNAEFKGKITSTSGSIGGWTISSNSLSSDNSSSILQYYEDGSSNPAIRIIDGKVICGKYTSSSNFYQNDGYADISCDGVYVGSPNISSGYLFSADVPNNQITCNVDMYTNGIRLNKDKYILSGYWLTEAGGSPLSVIGISSGQNIWIGHYNTTYTTCVASIVLNGIKTDVKGTLYTPDGIITSSDKRLKTDISNLDESAVSFILGLKPSKYKLINGSSNRDHYGFIAQDVKETMEDTIGDVGLIIKNEIGTTDDDGHVAVDYDDENTYYYGLRYEEFIAPMVKTIQSLESRISELEAQLKGGDE